VSTDDTIAEQRAAMESAFARLPILPGADVREASVGGVPGRWLTPRRKRPGVLAYFHGGAYTLGSSRTHAPPTGWPWRATRPVAAGLSIAAMLRARDAGAPQPAAAWLLCPWVDLTMAHSLPVMGESGDLRPEELSWSARGYAGERLADPMVSPMLADLSGLGPLLVQTGGDDALGEEAIVLAANAVVAGVDVRLEVFEEMGHVFQLLYTPFPEAVAARRHGARFLDNHLSA